MEIYLFVLGAIVIGLVIARIAILLVMHRVVYI